MSSVGQLVGGIVGGVIGFFAGGNVILGAQIGMMIGGAIDPPDGPVINGPRLDDLSVQTSTYGTFIPRNYGTIAQTGNVFWLKGDALTETPRVEESGGKGGPSTTTNLWDYSATFALGLCEGPIDGIRRIWINGQLFYDAASNDLATIIASNGKADLFTLYLGTDTQLPDPLMQADKGVANVPAYRGLAYIVFDNLPLAKYNNSLAGAQIKVEIVQSGTTAAPVVIQTTEIASNGGLFPVAQRVGGNELTCAFSDPTWDNSYPPNGTLHNISVIGAGTYITTPRTIAITQVPRLNQSPYGRGSLIYQDTKTYYFSGDTGLDLVYKFTGTPLARIWINADSSFYAISSLRNIEDQYTQKIRLFRPVSSTSADNSSIGATSQIFASISDSNSALFMHPSGNLVLIVTGHTYILDHKTLELIEDRTNTITFDSHSAVSIDLDSNVWMANYTDGSNLWRLNPEMTAVAQVYSVGLMSGVSSGSCVIQVAGNIYMRAAATSTAGIKIEYLNLAPFSPSTVMLSSIVQAECLASSILSAGDLDVTELTDSVRGYRIASLGALRGGIEPLRAAWPFDVVQNGYKIKFKRRGSASVVTIDADELDARAAGDNPGVQITNSREMDTLLPSSLRLNYIDSLREYETNGQISDRGL
jgi:hypothetical protein